MRKITLLFTIMFAAFSVSFGQSGWTLVDSGLPVSKGVGQISVGIDDSTALWGMAINGDGSIYDAFTRSTDGGKTWESGTFNAGTGLSQIFAFDANVCWAVFNSGADQGLYKTVDGGTTWVKKGTAYGSTSFANVLHFFDDMNGFAEGDPESGYFELYTTTDGGENWTRVPQANIPAPLTGEYGITGNYTAVGADHVWFGTNMGRIFSSTDKGNTWTASTTTLQDGGNPATVNSLMFDDMNGIAYKSYLNIGTEDQFNVTTDGGATWVDLFPAGVNFARYLYYVPGTDNTIIGSAGSSSANGMGISISYDGGANWEIITEGYSFLASAWLDLETGWCGTDVSISRSSGGMYIYGNPPAPTNLQATVDEEFDYVNLSWDAPSEATSFLKSTSTLELLGYNIYRDGSKINGDLIEPVEYTDTLAPIGSLEYYVTAVYNGGESDPSDTATVVVTNIYNVGENVLKLYPNPAKDFLRISANNNIRHIRILNNIGQMVFDSPMNGKEVQINTSQFDAGIYFLQLETANGISTQKFIVE